MSSSSVTSNSSLRHLQLVRLQFFASRTTGSKNTRRQHRPPPKLTIFGLSRENCALVYLLLITFQCLQIFFFHFVCIFYYLQETWYSEFIFHYPKLQLYQLFFGTTELTISLIIDNLDICHKKITQKIGKAKRTLVGFRAHSKSRMTLSW